MSETPATIAAWQEATFGTPGSNASYAIRALRELAELIQWLSDDDNHPEAGKEIADVLICLFGASHRMGLDLQVEVDRKMAINRARKWRMTGPGHGQHIPDEPRP